MPTARIVVKSDMTAVEPIKAIDIEDESDSGLYCESPHSKVTLEDSISSCTEDNDAPTIRLNVGGTVFEVAVNTLKRIPGTRLSRLADNLYEDKSYRQATNDFFFNRNSAAFSDILEYYRCGELHLDQASCGAIFKRELRFWELDFKDISMCCWSKYDSNRADITMYKELDKLFEGPGEVTAPTDASSHWSWIKYYLYHTFEDPNFSILAKVFVFFSFLITAGSIFTFVAETHYIFQQLTLENGTVVPAPNLESTTTNCCCYFNLSEHLTNHSADTAVNSTHNETEEEHGLHNEEHIDSHIILHYLDFITLGYFIFELVVRFVVSYNRKRFFRETLNIVELICITAHITSLLEHQFTEDNNVHVEKAQPVIYLVKSLRIMRVFRIFRLFRHMTGFKVLAYTVLVSVYELLLILSFLFAGVLIFASIIHYVEEETFTSIPYAIWWAVVTMTTVGYGDVTPKSSMGYFIGALCVVSGALVVAFTVPVVVNNFTQYYTLSRSRKAKINQTGQHQVAQDTVTKWVKSPGHKEEIDEGHDRSIVEIKFSPTPNPSKLTPTPNPPKEAQWS